MRGQCVVALPSARMRSEGYGSCRVCQSTALIYSVLVAQLHTRQTGHTNGLSIVVAPEFILAFSLGPIAHICAHLFRTFGARSAYTRGMSHLFFPSLYLSLRV